MGDNNNRARDGHVPGSVFFALIIVLSPILGQYASVIPGLSIVDIFLGICCIVLLILNRKYRLNRLNTKPLVIFWFYAIFISMFSFLLQQSLNLIVLTRIIRTSFFIFIILLTHNNVNQKVLFKAYKTVSLFAAIYIIAQVIVYNIFGVLLPFKLLPMPWMDGRIFGTTEAIQWAQRWYLRPSAFFLEPGYAAQYLLPALVFALFGWFSDEQKFDLKYVALIFTALALTTSSQGLHIGVIIISLYFMGYISKKGSYLSIIKNAIIFVTFIIGFLFLINTDFFNNSISYIIGNSTAGGSTAFRLLRGPAVYNKLPILYKVIGVGHGNIGEFVLRNGIYTKYDPSIMELIAADYVNGISAVLIYYGILGLVLWGIFIFKLWHKTAITGRYIIVTFIILTFVSSTFISYTTILYVALIYSSSQLRNLTNYGKFINGHE